MSAEQEEQTSNRSSSDRNEMCHLYLHLWPLDVKQRPGGGVCGGQICEEVDPVSPAEPQLSCRAPVFCKHKPAFLPYNNRHSWPPQDLLWKESYLLSQLLRLGLFPSCAVASGCQQATTADTDGSPGPWWLPYVTVHLQVCAFFTVFLSVPHLFFFLFFSWKGPTGTERRCYKGSNVIPINTFQHRVATPAWGLHFAEWLLKGRMLQG